MRNTPIKTEELTVHGIYKSTRWVGVRQKFCVSVLAGRQVFEYDTKKEQVEAAEAWWRFFQDAQPRRHRWATVSWRARVGNNTHRTYRCVHCWTERVTVVTAKHVSGKILRTEILYRPLFEPSFRQHRWCPPCDYAAPIGA